MGCRCSKDNEGEREARIDQVEGEVADMTMHSQVRGCIEGAVRLVEAGKERVLPDDPGLTQGNDRRLLSPNEEANESSSKRMMKPYQAMMIFVLIAGGFFQM